MIYHIHFFNKSLYSSPTHIHILSNKPEIPPDIPMTFECIGYEKIPIEAHLEEPVIIEVNIKKKYWWDVVIEEHIEKKIIRGKLDENLVNELSKYRLSYLSIDIDEQEIESRVVEGLSNFKVFKSGRGFHIIAPKKFNSFRELLNERSFRFDDVSRRNIDELYVKEGLAFLTNSVFYKKCYFNEELKQYECSEQKEVTDLSEVFVDREYTDYELSKKTIKTQWGVVEIDKDPWGKGSVIKFRGLFPKHVKERILGDIMRGPEVIKQKLIKEYSKISRMLASVLKECEITVSDNLVTIVVPAKHEKYVGLLIGREGSNVKRVQEAVGVKIRIASTTSRYQVKKKAESLIEELLEVSGS